MTRAAGAALFGPLVLAMVAVGPAKAEALCYLRYDTLPRPGNTNVPVNAVFLVTPGGTGVRPVLRDPSGAAVWTRVDVVAGGALVVRPLEELAPGTEYALELDGVPTVVSTGAVRDTEPPTAPTVKSFNRRVSPARRGVGNDETIALEVTGASDDLTLEAELAMNVFTGATEDSIDYSQPSMVLNGPTRWLGNGGCAMNFPLSGTADLAIALQAIDTAGNLSPVGPPKQLKVAGCQAVAGAGPLAFLALALLGGRGRRRR